MKDINVDVEQIQEAIETLERINELVEENIEDLEMFFDIYEEEQESSAVSKVEDIVDKLKDSLTAYIDANGALTREKEHYIDELADILGRKHIEANPINLEYDEIKKSADNLPLLSLPFSAGVRKEYSDHEKDQKSKKNFKIMTDIDEELNRVENKVNEIINEIKKEIVPEFEQIEEYEDNMDLSHIGDLFDDYEALEFQAMQSYNSNLTSNQKAKLSDMYNNLSKDNIYNYIVGVKPNEENIINNLMLFFGMSEIIAEELIQFYKDLLNSNIPLEDISKYFWGIQSSTVSKYQSKPFLFTNGDYTGFQKYMYNNYKKLYEFLNDGMEGAIFDYPHITATMSADSNWNGENNNFVADVANWGMGEGGDSISAIYSGNPGLFGQVDKNSDGLSNMLQTPSNSSEIFILLLSSDDFDEELMKELQNQHIQGIQYE